MLKKIIEVLRLTITLNNSVKQDFYCSNRNELIANNLQLEKYLLCLHMQNLSLSLKKSGYKLTSPRKVILNVLEKFNKPMTLNEIHSACNSIDFASVYRSLKLFNEIGLVEEVNFADKKVRYELSNNSHHHHVICSECGEIKELPICILSEIEKLTNYTITKHTFEFVGVCPNCKN